MAKRTITELVDDITGDPVPRDTGESITFTFDGANYEIDLNDKNAAKMREAIGFYVQHAQRLGARRATSSTTTSGAKTDPLQLAAMRTWLREQGHQVADKGRIAANLQKLYHDANS